MPVNSDLLRAVTALGETPNADIPCPRCGEGCLEAYEQHVGHQRFIHVWCSADEGHYMCVDGPREGLFEGVRDVSERDEAIATKAAA